MHRFYLPPEQIKGEILCLSEGEAHHALHVLRVRTGDPVVVLDGAGIQYSGQVEACGRKDVQIRVLERRSVPPLPFQVTLFQAIPKGKIIESIVQKATELGVARIVPLLTERVVTHLDEESAPAKVAKWRSVAVEAIKQCGSAWLPAIEAPTRLQDALSQMKPDLALVGSLESGSRHPREFFREFQAQGNKPKCVAVWVGPEGDFTPEELQLLRASGVLPITLGPLVLRSETAAICCISIANYELQSAT